MEGLTVLTVLWLLLMLFLIIRFFVRLPGTVDKINAAVAEKEFARQARVKRDADIFFDELERRYRTKGATGQDQRHQ